MTCYEMSEAFPESSRLCAPGASRADLAAEALDRGYLDEIPATIVKDREHANYYELDPNRSRPATSVADFQKLACTSKEFNRQKREFEWMTDFTSVDVQTPLVGEGPRIRQALRDAGLGLTSIPCSPSEEVSTESPCGFYTPGSRTIETTTYITARVGVTCEDAKPIAKATFQTRGTVSGETEKWSIEGWSCKRTVSDTANSPYGGP